MKMDEERTAGHATRRVFEREAGPTSCNYSYLRDVPGTLCLDPSFKLTEKPRGRRRRESPRDRTKRCSERWVGRREAKEKSEKEGRRRMKVTYIEGERIQIAEESSSGVPGPLDNRVRSIGASGAADGNESSSLKMRSIILLLVSLRLSFATAGRHHRDGGFLNHVQLVHEFRCSAPQPRAVPIAELLTVGPSPDEFFYPASTVLTRCDGAGCCPDPRQICAPVETRNVSLVFMVKHMIDRQRDRHHEVVHALEHTKCGCVDKKLIEFD